ncbi:hypothetical protein [Streptomyces umbrinus]|uniref:hypothetical protein n=1 Tax=Streptomyces umbrinus TaxID=67370 RepID=UPI00340E0226
MELPLLGGPGRPAPAGDVLRTPAAAEVAVFTALDGTRRRLGGRAVARRDRDRVTR